MEQITGDVALDAKLAPALESIEEARKRTIVAVFLIAIAGTVGFIGILMSLNLPGFVYLLFPIGAAISIAALVGRFLQNATHQVVPKIAKVVGLGYEFKDMDTWVEGWVRDGLLPRTRNIGGKRNSVFGEFAGRNFQAIEVILLRGKSSRPRFKGVVVTMELAVEQVPFVVMTPENDRSNWVKSSKLETGRHELIKTIETPKGQAFHTYLFKEALHDGQISRIQSLLRLDTEIPKGRLYAIQGTEAKVTVALSYPNFLFRLSLIPGKTRLKADLKRILSEFQMLLSVVEIILASEKPISGDDPAQQEALAAVHSAE